ncbi:MAG: hypothetical protein L3J62_10040 [Gammaproteobacteria bacterium]|nr:hypothetical protein [Gammaproteobacteria bacterium]
MKLTSIIPSFILLSFVSAVSAAEPETDQKTETLQIEEQRPGKVTAERWGLTLSQWQHYETYMEEEGRFFYEHLDPVFVSGLIAKTQIERQQIAQLYAEQELERTTRLIAFQDDFTRAMKHLGADQNMLSIDKMRDLFGDQSGAPSEKPRSGDRIALFVSIQCGDRCENVFNSHYQRLDKTYPANISIDVYFVGKHSDAQIQGWAKQLDLNPDLVKSGRITLNHDDRYELFGRPLLPAAFLVRGSKVVGSL